MPRRLLVPTLAPGPNPLPSDQAHHARDVLRLAVGDAVELFTPAGQVAQATLTQVTPETVIAEVRQIGTAAAAFQLTIASAIPKAARADWMIEKLSELGVARFVPLATDRSVVHPEGRNKIERWQRLAAESAKQCHRPGVMQIDPLIPLSSFLGRAPKASGSSPEAPSPAWGYLSTATPCLPLPSILHPPSSLTLLVGPEGGWSDGERAAFAERHLTPVTLGTTILRVETAAIAAAAIVAALTPFSAENVEKSPIGNPP
jgi:16S rRNA (uracil1498-N3)-methyltransferase